MLSRSEKRGCLLELFDRTVSLSRENSSRETSTNGRLHRSWIGQTDVLKVVNKSFQLIWLVVIEKHLLLNPIEIAENILNDEVLMSDGYVLAEHDGG